MKIIRVRGPFYDFNRAQHARIAELVEQAGFQRYTPARFFLEGRDVRLWLSEPQAPGCQEVDWRDLHFDPVELVETRGDPAVEVRVPLRVLRGTTLCYYRSLNRGWGRFPTLAGGEFHLCTRDGYPLDADRSDFQERACEEMGEAQAQVWVMLLARHPWWPVPPDEVIAARQARLVVKTRENTVRLLLEDLIEELAYRALELPLEVALEQGGLAAARMDALKAELARLLTSLDEPEVLVAKLKWAARGGRLSGFDLGQSCHSEEEAQARSAMSDEEYDEADFPSDLELEGSFMEHLAQYSGRVVEALRASCEKGALGMSAVEELLWQHVHLQDTPQTSARLRILLECLYALEERFGVPTETLCCLY
jgi:hypothetical protein